MSSPLKAGTLAAGSLVGRPVRRVEDPTLLQGDASHIDNLRIDGLLHAAFVRSTMARARIRDIDLTEAFAAPGVVRVFLADDLHLPPYGGLAQMNPKVNRPVLADGEVKFVGEAIAMV